MRVKLITLRYSETLGGFDDTPLQEYTRDKEVLTFREHFFTVHETPHLTCVLTCQEPVVGPEILASARQVAADEPAAQPGAQRGRARKRQSDPTAGLDEPERALFNTLRAWRLDQSRAQGIPPYVILRNRDLIALVKKRPESRTALGHIDGIGPKTIERYGDALLQLLPRPRSAAGPPPTNPERARGEAASGSKDPAHGTNPAPPAATA